MNRFLKFTVPMLALGMFLALPALMARGDDAPATQPAKTGSITVKVVDSDGNAVSGANVRIMAPDAARGADPVAKGTTDDKGMATIKDIPVGDYNAVAMLRAKGNGRAKVTVAAETPADAAPVTITLKERPQRQNNN